MVEEGYIAVISAVLSGGMTANRGHAKKTTNASCVAVRSCRAVTIIAVMNAEKHKKRKEYQIRSVVLKGFLTALPLMRA